MTGMKALKGTAVILSLAALTACGQGYTPSAEEHIAAPHGGGDVFGSGSDNTTYRTASYEVLRSTLIDLMGVGDVTAPAAECSAAVVAAAGCPKYAPLNYLQANKGSLGAPVYNQADPNASQVPGLMSSGGFKAWILASTSASGLMMNQATPMLFPQGITNFDYLYQALLGRLPTDVENARLNQLAADIATANPSLNTMELGKRQGAAIASSVLGSMEFLMVN